MTTQHLDLHLAALVDGFRGISPGRCLRAAEAASICLARQHGTERATFESNRQEQFVCWVTRLAVTDDMDASYDVFELAEDGAEGISFLLVAALDEGARFTRAVRGTGIDFWVTGGGDMFQGGRRLEASGLYDARMREIRARAREKRRQTEQSAGSGPALVVVVEFGRPYIWMEDV